MWFKISHSIIRYRTIIIGVILLITVFMAFKAKEARMSYDFVAAVPETDAELLYFKEFKQLFGEDANALVIGLEGKKLYQLNNFNQFIELSKKISKLEGVNQVIALPQIQYLSKDTLDKKFIPKPVFAKTPQTQKELDSLLNFAGKLQFYQRQLINPQNGATVALISIRKDVNDSPKRGKLINDIQDLGQAFSDKTGIEIHYGGVPLLRTFIMQKLAAELNILLILSGVATGILLFLFFNSITAVVIPLLIIGIVVVWSIGLITLLGYKVTILTGLLPPLLVVIGVPNCVYLLNRYHQEYRLLRDKKKALAKIIRKIGIVAFMTNATTSVGFGVYIFMDVVTLKQFGVVSSISVFFAFIVSMLMVPILYSYLPSPTNKELKHLDRKPLHAFFDFLEYTVFHRRTIVFVVVILLTVLSAIGIYQVKALSFMTDNIPYNSQPKKDLVFFEKNFKGVMPLEIEVDTKKKKGVMRLSNLKKIEQLEKSLDTLSLVSKPLSVISLVKASKQAFYNNNVEFYELPTNNDFAFILNYLQSGQHTTAQRLLRSFVDSTGQKMRISLKVADVGSEKLDYLIKKVIQPKIKKAFPNSDKMEAKVTGTTYIFIKGNLYLINSLLSSIFLSIGVVALLMATLFTSFRIILISVISNSLPLAMTAALMGFFAIPLKPSSAIIFSIAFGIAVDTSIHFLARYRQELIVHKYSVADAVKISLRETGAGMFYTSIVLFFGFIVFAYSDFEGTKTLGALSSTTLLVAMFSNLILLPCLLIAFDSGKYRKNSMQLIDYYDEYGINEQDDEEINLDLLKVEKKNEGVDL